MTLSTSLVRQASRRCTLGASRLECISASRLSRRNMSDTFKSKVIIVTGAVRSNDHTSGGVQYQLIVFRTEALAKQYANLYWMIHLYHNSTSMQHPEKAHRSALVPKMMTKPSTTHSSTSLNPAASPPSPRPSSKTASRFYTKISNLNKFIIN